MKDTNIQALELAVHSLGSLANDFVFVGGATVGLYIDDIAIPSVRPTDDVDCVVEVASKLEYQKIEQQLWSLKFKPCMDGPRCRFKKDSILLDVMPTDENILGFTNKWYAKGIERSTKVSLPSGQTIAVFELCHFIASKLEAFKGRGKADFFGSHDIEDIVAVIDGRLQFEKNIESSKGDVRKYIKNAFEDYLKDYRFAEAIEGHISDRQNTNARAKLVLSRMKLF